MAQDVPFTDNVMKLIRVYSRFFKHSLMLITFCFNLQAISEYYTGKINCFDLYQCIEITGGV